MCHDSAVVLSEYAKSQGCLSCEQLRVALRAVVDDCVAVSMVSASRGEFRAWICMANKAGEVLGLPPRCLRCGSDHCPGGCEAFYKHLPVQ